MDFKLAESMKKAILVIIEEVDLHLQTKMELLIQTAIDKKYPKGNSLSDVKPSDQKQLTNDDKKDSVSREIVKRTSVEIKKNAGKMKQKTSPKFSRILRSTEESPKKAAQK